MANSSNDPKSKRQERLEAQLRENLKRRREQARARRDLAEPAADGSNGERGVEELGEAN